MRILMPAVHILATAATILLVDGCIFPGHWSPGETSLFAVTPEQNAITFWGHACCYIDLDGTGIVTDPVFDDSYSIIRKRVVPPPPPSAYAATKVILISHAHRDHLSPKTLATFPDSAVILCPEPSRKYLTDLAMTVHVLVPGESYQTGSVTITAVPAYHPGGRNSYKAAADGRALGYIIYTKEATLYYSGDTEYFEGLKAIGETYHPDIAILNLNSHLKSDDFLRAALSIGARRVVPIHYGAYTGPSSVSGPRWCRELKETLESMLITIDVGGYFPIRELASSPVRNSGMKAKADK